MELHCTTDNEIAGEEVRCRVKTNGSSKNKMKQKTIPMSLLRNERFVVGHDKL